MRLASRSLLWAAVFCLLVALAVPWFLWGDGSTAYGLPIWLWWHVGWMVLTTAVFAAFTRYGWGLWTGVEA